jgi:hypothetical protein
MVPRLKGGLVAEKHFKQFTREKPGTDQGQTTNAQGRLCFMGAVGTGHGFCFTGARTPGDRPRFCWGQTTKTGVRSAAWGTLGTDRGFWCFMGAVGSFGDRPRFWGGFCGDRPRFLLRRRKVGDRPRTLGDRPRFCAVEVPTRPWMRVLAPWSRQQVR